MPTQTGSVFPIGMLEKYSVRKDAKGGKNMRKHYIDNIRSLTVILVVCYHIVYLFNGIVQDGVIGSLTDWHGMDVVTDLLAGYALPLAGAAGVLGIKKDRL